MSNFWKLNIVVFLWFLGMGILLGWSLHNFPPPVTAALDPHQQHEELVAAISTAPSPITDWLFPCQILSVHDGDTYHIDVDLAWGVHVHDTVRCLGFDAYEVTKTRRTVGTITDEEILKGMAARDAVKQLFLTSVVYIQPEYPESHRDPYGRLLGFIRVKTQDGQIIRLEDWMHEKGYCRQ